MNPNEQKHHKRRTDEIAASVEALSDAADSRIAELEADLRARVSDERTHRLKLADEQRAYVDAENRALRQHGIAAEKQILDALSAFRDRAFLGRLRWLFRGM